MNKINFNLWWADFKTRWPSRVLELRKDKLTGQDRTEDDQKRFLRMWSEALDDVELTEALEVNRKWFAGEIETPKWFHLEDTPAFVRQNAIAARPREASWTGPSDIDQDFRLPLQGVKGLMRSICMNLEDGMSKEEAAERLTAGMGANGLRRKERTYNCVPCLDSGRVEVWHPDCVALAASQGVDAVDAFHWRVSVCACFCAKGNGPAARLVRYDTAKHCRVVPMAGATGRTCSPQALAGLAEWLEDQRQIARKAVGDPLFHQHSVGVSQ